jgi:uncharacterized FlaG/YvyC family protein
MIDPINGSGPVSVKDAKVPVLLTSRTDIKSSGNNSSEIVAPVKKTNETLEKIDRKSRESIEKTIQAIKDFIESNNRSLKFQVDQGSGQIIIKIISEKDGTVIKEIPVGKAIEIAENTADFSGILFNKNA